MTDYTELVRSLRHCSHDGIVKCNECKYGGKEWPIGCEDEMMRDAAAAIEALQAQLPKRGEWITIRLNNGGSYTGCSCCEAPIPTDTMLDYIPESESKYCYSCGAKMEVQDG